MLQSYIECYDRTVRQPSFHLWLSFSNCNHRFNFIWVVYLTVVKIDDRRAKFSTCAVAISLTRHSQVASVSSTLVSMLQSNMLMMFWFTVLNLHVIRQFVHFRILFGLYAVGKNMAAPFANHGFGGLWRRSQPKWNDTITFVSVASDQKYATVLH